MIKITDGFWKFYNDLNRNSIVKSVYGRFKETGRFDALKCNKNSELRPHIFWDSDVAKWIEGAAYLISSHPDTGLEAKTDEMVEDIARNQREDGYFNSYFLTLEPENIFKGRENHELYCLGHLIEAAIAYDKATGKDKLLNCILKYTDMVYRIFVTEGSAGFVTPGHQEIELALLKLYGYTGNEKHLELARFFIHKRANNAIEEKTVYDQSDVPAVDIAEAKGHAVRACYFYTAIAMLARIDGDQRLLDACRRVYTDITERKMSITGGIGAEPREEQFSYAYDLPNNSTYNETCAAISLMLFSEAMSETEENSKYADIIERILYNGFLSGVSLDGKSFFYSNPLEIDRRKYQRSTYQAECERSEVFECSCCPPNVVRILGSLSHFIYRVKGKRIYCEQFAQSSAEFKIGGKKAALTQTTDYPLSGSIRFDYMGEPVTLCVRIPDWCVEYGGKTENGYAVFELKDGDSIKLDLPMIPHFIECDPRVQDNSGRYALMRGPVVYCMEGKDNGEELRDITLIENGNISVENTDEFPCPVIYIDAERRMESDKLYRIKNNSRISFRAKLIPYFAFANRGADDMIVWTMLK